MGEIGNKLDLEDTLRHSFLIRNTSCMSMVEMPTFITSNIILKSQCCDKHDHSKNVVTNGEISLVEKLANYQPLLEAKTRRKKQQLEKHLMVMATVFLVLCLLMVGTMFAVTTEYQDTMVANMINMSKLERGWTLAKEQELLEENIR